MTTPENAIRRPSWDDPNKVGHHHRDEAGESLEPTGHGEGGPASRRITVTYGFWVYILSDIVMFSAFFATFAVLRNATDGGPTSKDLFDLRLVAYETAFLLMSSFTCGMAMISASVRNHAWTQGWLIATAVFGIAFLILELVEFQHLIAVGAGPSRSAFLSSFFALVGLHGLHVFAGILWLFTMMAQIAAKGFRPDVLRRLSCFALFWHALDIIWVALFTVVYLMGTL